MGKLGEYRFNNLIEYPDHITNVKNDLSNTYTSMYDIWKQKKNRLKIIQAHLVMFFHVKYNMSTNDITRLFHWIEVTLYVII